MVATALVLTLGLHWAALQTVAWTTMLASNLRSGSFSEAVDKTFDGRHPCCLCKAIAAAKKSESKSATASPAFKMEFPLLAQSAPLIPPAPAPMISRPISFAGSPSWQPPVPPPRSIPA